MPQYHELIYSDLAYAACSNPILLSNLNYKEGVKFCR